MRFIENGRLHKAVRGNLSAIGKDHPGAVNGNFHASITKRLAGGIRGLISDVLGVASPERCDPYEKHCPSCACERDLVQRSQGGALMPRRVPAETMAMARFGAKVLRRADRPCVVFEVGRGIIEGGTQCDEIDCLPCQAKRVVAAVLAGRWRSA